MSFYRKNRNNDNYREQPSGEKKKARFQVSDKSVQSASVLSSFAITIFAFILFVIKAEFVISESDIQTISGIAAGLCGFALAIPLFLKDFDITSNFWKQFYLIAITFLVAAFIGVISFLIMGGTTSIGVTLYLWFFISIVISVNINILLNKVSVKFSTNPVLNLSIAYFTLFISLIFSEGHFGIYTTILFTIYGFYLTSTLMISILVELFFANPKTEDNDTRIKKAIQHIIEKNRDRAFDEQTLLDKLKSEVFPNEQEIISRTKVQELVSEMDFETTVNEPKITIYKYDNIIPRWWKEYDEILNRTDVVIFIKEKDDDRYYRSDEIDSVSQKEIDGIYDILSNKTGLSKELLIENNSISKYYFVKGKIEYTVTHGHLSKENLEVKEINCLLLINSINSFIKPHSQVLLLNSKYDISYLRDYFNIKLKNLENFPIKIIWEKRLNEAL
jgi:hypothetical protein